MADLTDASAYSTDANAYTESQKAAIRTALRTLVLTYYTNASGKKTAGWSQTAVQTALDGNVTGGSDYAIYLNDSAGLWNLFIDLLRTDVAANTTAIAGIDGVLSGSGAPSNSLGDNGNVYINTVNGTIYTKTGGAWIQVVTAASLSQLATTTQAGLVQLATDAIAAAFANSENAVVPSNFADATFITNLTAALDAATTTASGVVEKSTSAENTAGTATDVFPDVAGVKSMIDTHAPTSSAADQRLLFLLVAELYGDRINMVDGIVDAFEDETDVDTGTSTGEYYDSTLDNYVGQVAVSQATGTAIGDMTNNGGLAAAFDGNASQVATSSASKTAGDRTQGYIGKDWGSGVTKTINGVVAVAPSDQGFNQVNTNTITITLEGSTDNFSGSVVDLGSGTITNGTGSITFTKRSGFDTSTAYRYHRIKVTDSGGSSTENKNVCELTFYEVAALTLVSNAFTADSAPATARIHVQVKASASITVNTDLTAEVTRDGGTTWTTATLVEVETLSDGTVAYEDASLDISAQPSGTSMKYRIKSLNSKDIEVHGVILQWA